VTVGPQDIVHVVWYDAYASDAGIYYARSVDHGLSFLPALRVNEFGGARYPSPTVLATGENVYVAYAAASAPSPVRLNVYDNFGAAMDHSMEITPLGESPALAADSYGNVFVAWHQYDGPSFEQEVWGIWLDANPSTPPGFAATQGGTAGEVVLSWYPNPDPDVAGYLLHRAASDGAQVLVSAPGAQATTWTDSDRPNGEWRYFLAATDRQGHVGLAASATVVLGPTAQDLIREIEGEVDRLESEVRNLEAENDALESAIVNSTSELTDVRDRIPALQTQIALLAVLVAALSLTSVVFALRIRRGKGES
jgi:hypothetical protein